MNRPLWILALMLVGVAVLVLAPSQHLVEAAKFRNLQVLDKNISGDELKGLMNGFTEQLGVKCTFCHVLDEYDKDDLEHKRVARRMIRLIQDLNSNKDQYFLSDKEAKQISCWTCHRGSVEIEPYASED
jgi:hypothetical protein